jgi:hypothetical protein
LQKHGDTSSQSGLSLQWLGASALQGSLPPSGWWLSPRRVQPLEYAMRAKNKKA